MNAALRSASALLCAALAGCGGSPPPAYTKAHIDDHSVLVPSLRAVIPLRGQESALDAASGHAVEVRATRVQGSGSQSHGSGAPIRLGDVSYVAPTTLQYDFALTNAEIAYRYRKLWGGSGIEALVGVGFNGLRVAASAPGMSSNESIDSVGPVVGIGALWRLRPGTSVQGRVSAWYGAAFDGLYSDLLRAEVYLVQTLGKHVALRAGYAAWQIDRDTDGNSSDIRVRFSGPALGLDVSF